MFSFRSSSFSWARVAAWTRRDARGRGASCDLTLRIVGPKLGGCRLVTTGLDGTLGTAMLGGGGGAILAAFPTPLGSLTELLIPPTLPGPRGIPLTPASPAFCATDVMGASKPAKKASATNVDLADIDDSPLTI
jgi:hypothetical protein